jgi:hypothetical protein
MSLKKDMIKQCQLANINDFDNNYTFDNVLKWYTKDSFVFRLVNRAFRTQNIHLILCKFQYFIILLHDKLK